MKNLLLYLSDPQRLPAIQNLFEKAGYKNFHNLTEKNLSLETIKIQAKKENNTLFMTGSDEIIQKLSPVLKETGNIIIVFLYNNINYIIASAFEEKIDVNEAINNWLKSAQNIIKYYKDLSSISYIVELKDIAAHPTELPEILDVNLTKEALSKLDGQFKLKIPDKPYLLCANDIISKNPLLRQTEDELSIWKTNLTQLSPDILLKQNKSFKRLIIKKEEELSSANQQIISLSNQLSDRDTKLSQSVKSIENKDKEYNHLKDKTVEALAIKQKEINQQSEKLKEYEQKIIILQNTTRKYESQIAELKANNEKPHLEFNNQEMTTKAFSEEILKLKKELSDTNIKFRQIENQFVKADAQINLLKELLLNNQMISN